MPIRPPRVPGPLRIGLTGGIASGKTLASHLFEELGVPVIDADMVAREVVAPGTALLKRVLEKFEPIVQANYGASLRRADGSLHRAWLRRLVFDDPAQRQALEAMLHPAIRARSEELAASVGGPYQIHVNPLLVETSAQDRYDRVLVVDCPEELQLARLLARDGSDRQQAQAMIEAQARRTARLVAADDVLHNDSTPEALAAQVRDLHPQYVALADDYRALEAQDPSPSS